MSYNAKFPAADVLISSFWNKNPSPCPQSQRMASMNSQTPTVASEQYLLKGGMYRALGIDTERGKEPAQGGTYGSFYTLTSVKFSSAAQSCLTHCDPMDCNTLASLSITNSWSLLKPIYIEPGMASKQLILCQPLLKLLSIFPSIRVFSNESVLCIRWLKYWSFSFNTSPSNEYSRLISLMMDWLDLLAVQGTLKSLL